RVSVSQCPDGNRALVERGRCRSSPAKGFVDGSLDCHVRHDVPAVRGAPARTATFETPDRRLRPLVLGGPDDAARHAPGGTHDHEAVVSWGALRVGRAFRPGPIGGPERPPNDSDLGMARYAGKKPVATSASGATPSDAARTSTSFL